MLPYAAFGAGRGYFRYPFAETMPRRRYRRIGYFIFIIIKVFVTNGAFVMPLYPVLGAGRGYFRYPFAELMPRGGNIIYRVSVAAA